MFLAYSTTRTASLAAATSESYADLQAAAVAPLFARQHARNV